MRNEIEKFYYMSAEKMAADGFVNGYRTRWTAGFGEIVEAAEVVPTIGDLPRDGWSLSEEFSDRQDRYVTVGLETPDLFIGLDGTVSARREYKIADYAENNGGRMFYVPRRALTAEESAFAAETMSRLLAEKDAAAKRQADMVAAINAGEDPADWE